MKCATTADDENFTWTHLIQFMALCTVNAAAVLKLHMLWNFWHQNLNTDLNASGVLAKLLLVL